MRQFYRQEPIVSSHFAFRGSQVRVQDPAAPIHGRIRGHPELEPTFTDQMAEPGGSDGRSSVLIRGG